MHLDLDSDCDQSFQMVVVMLISENPITGFHLKKQEN